MTQEHTWRIRTVDNMVLALWKLNMQKIWVFFYTDSLFNMKCSRHMTSVLVKIKPTLSRRVVDSNVDFYDLTRDR